MREEDKINLILSLIFILMIIFILILSLLMVDIATTKKVGTKDTACYDAHQNKIKDLTCKEKIYCTKWGIIADKCEGEGK